MSDVGPTAKYAPPGHAGLGPCQRLDGPADLGIEYAGAGVPLREHPFFAHAERDFGPLSSRCGACGREGALCVYVSWIGGLGTGKDMALELRCPACGQYTADYFIS